MATVKTADEYVKSHKKWELQLQILRDLMNEFPLEETIKWGVPVYTLDGKNLTGIAAFKNHYAIWFYQGALLTKNTKLLVNAQEGKTNSLRQIRFEEGATIDTGELRNYIAETIEMHRQGKEAPQKAFKPLVLPAELQKKLEEDKIVYDAFEELTKGKQREFAEYISQAKKEETRKNRIIKIIPLIIKGVGLNDKYRKS